MEPAPGYVPFVESHLSRLRRDAQRLTGDGSIAEEVSSGALTDVALRWFWFELLRGLGRGDRAGAFLGIALARRCARRLGEPDGVRGGLDADTRPVVLVQPVRPARATGWPSAAAAGWYPEPDVIVATDPPADPLRPGAGSRAPTATSVAVRLAAIAVRAAPPPSAALEAVIAWLHAYETFVRYRRIAVATAVAIVALALAKLRNYGAEF